MKKNREPQTRFSADGHWEPSNWHVLALLTALVAVYFHKILLGQSFLWEDFLYQWYPFRQFAASSMAQGEIPLWNPYNFNGMPFLADIQTQVFYLPLTALAFLVRNGRLDVLWLEAVNILHYLIAGAGMFYLAKSFKLRQIPALCAAVAYTFSGFMITHAIHQIIITLVCWYPWVLLVLRRSLDEQSWRWVFVGGLLLGHTFFAGFPQLSLFLYLFLGAYVAFELLTRYGLRGLFTRPARIMMGKAAAMVVLSIGIMMIQLLPTVELSKLSVRAEITYEKSTEGSLAWSQLLTLVFPKLFGTADAHGYNYWGPGTYWYYWETCIYVGILPLFLTLLSIPFVRRSKYIPFFLGYALFAVLYALGGNFILQKFFFDYVPLFSTFRNPARMTVFVAFGAALLSAFTLQYLLYEPRRVRENRSLRAILFSSVGVSVILWALIASGSLSGFLSFMTRPEIASTVRREAQISLTFVLMSGALLFWLVVATKHAWRIALGTSAVLFLDLFVFGGNHNTSSVNPEEYFARASPIVRFLRSDPEIFRVNTRTREGMIMDRNQGMVDHIFTMEGYTPLVLQRVYPPVASNEQMYDLLNVKYVTKAIEGASRLALEPNPSYLPRAFMVYTLHVVRSEEELLAYLKSSAFNHRTTAVLERDPGVALPRLQEEPTWHARVTAYTNNALSVDVETSHDGFLVLSEISYPGWKAYLDGRETDIYRADYNLRGLFVPTGRHTMEMRFEPLPFARGMAVTLVTLLICIAGIGVPLIRGRSSGAAKTTD
jgi:hypothetical protein